MKHRAFIGLCILLVLAFAVQCTSAPAPAPTSAPAPAPTSAPAAAPTQSGAFDWKRFAGTEITLLLNEHPWTVGLRPHVKEFEDLTGIKVNLQALADDLYWDKMELAIRSSKPEADVYFMPMDSTAYTQWTAHCAASLTPFLNDPSLTAPGYDLEDFPIGFRSVAMYPPGEANAELYGIPITFETYILFYNKDLIGKYLGGQVPETMDELIQAAAKITKESNGEVYGAVVRGIRSDTIMDTVTGVVLNSWGSDPTPLPQNVWFDNDWAKPRFTDPRIAEGLAYYAGMMKAAPPNIQSIDWQDASRLFQQGKAAFFIDASLFGPGFEDPKESQVAGKVGYAPLPKSSRGAMTGHWMWGLGIPANSAHKEAAWYFIQWATSKEVEPKIGTATGGAPRLSTWSNPAYASTLNADYVTAVQTAMKNSRPTAVFREGWKEAAVMIVDAIQAIYGGEEPVKATADLQKRVSEIVK